MGKELNYVQITADTISEAYSDSFRELISINQEKETTVRDLKGEMNFLEKNDELGNYLKVSGGAGFIMKRGWRITSQSGYGLVKLKPTGYNKYNNALGTAVGIAVMLFNFFYFRNEEKKARNRSKEILKKIDFLSKKSDNHIKSIIDTSPRVDHYPNSERMERIRETS